MLDFKKLDGFTRDLRNEEDVKELYAYVFDYSDEEIEDGELERLSIDEMRHWLVEFYTIYYDCVFCTRPNVYFICEEELYVKGEQK